MTSSSAPAHVLRDRLELAQLEAVRSLAVEWPAEEIPAEAIQYLAHLHMAILAVRDEIERHGPRIGHAGDEELEYAAQQP